MRIVMIGPFAFHPQGTVPVRMMPMAEMLDSRGHQVSVVLPPYDNLAESNKQYKVGHISVCNVGIPKVPSPLKQFVVSCRLVRTALKLKPDLLHVFKPVGYSGLAAMILILRRWLRLLKAPIVLDTDDWDGHGGFYDHFREHRVYPGYQLRFVRFQLGWVPRHVAAVTVASRALQSLVWSQGIPQDKVFYVPNGAQPFPPAERVVGREVLRERLGLTPNAPVVLLYTRFFEFDVGRVVEILKAVKQELGEAKLLVVGRGRFGEEAALVKLAQTEGVNDSVVFAGWIQPSELPSYLDLGDVSIYPFDDNLLNRAKCPGKVVELMSLGKAIVADRVGQIAEYLQNESSGILVEPGDTESFARAVIRVLKDESLRSRLGENAKQRIWDRFGWDRLALEVVAAYERATQEQRRWQNGKW